MRKDLIGKIQGQHTKLVSSYGIGHDIEIINLIVNPYHLIYSSNTTNKICVDAREYIDSYVEPACRTLLYKLHSRRYELLSQLQKGHRKSICESWLCVDRATR